ncbi:MAG: IreB family regulatory phosphoprotein [Defluviitaleaceae bacterium]|nr:IreB family regulatory phosphoprotein [Defluviitaleaceae bacterium]
MNTQKFDAFKREPNIEAKEILEAVYLALKKRGYNPMTQIVGYILSGDPTYITSHDNARAIIGRLERDELLEELVRDFLRDVIK